MSGRPLRHWKPGVRTAGVDDGPLPAAARGRVLVVGAVYSGPSVFEGVVAGRVRRDGWDATRKIAAMIGGSKYHAQLKAVLVDGVAMAGFNVVDLPRLTGLLDLPVALVMSRTPDLAAVRRALERVSRPERRWQAIRRAGPIHRAGGLLFQCAGVEPEAMAELLEYLSISGRVPEPLRAAHQIAGGITAGLR